MKRLGPQSNPNLCAALQKVKDVLKIVSKCPKVTTIIYSDHMTLPSDKLTPAELNSGLVKVPPRSRSRPTVRLSDCPTVAAPPLIAAACPATPDRSGHPSRRSTLPLVDPTAPADNTRATRGRPAAKPARTFPA